MYAQGLQGKSGSNPDGDGTLVLRVLLRSVLPFVTDTITAVAASEPPSRRCVVLPKVEEALTVLLGELGQQLEQVRCGPCETTERFKEAVAALVDKIEAHEEMNMNVALLRQAFFK